MTVTIKFKFLVFLFCLSMHLCSKMTSPEIIFRDVNFYSLGETTLSNHRFELLGPACSHWPMDIKKQTPFLIGKLWWHSFLRHFLGLKCTCWSQWKCSLKRLGKKATLYLFYSLRYTVITHSPKSHILSLGNSYKKRAPCSEHHHKYFVTQTEKTYNKYHEQKNWQCYWLQ